MKNTYSKILFPFLGLCLILTISNKGYSQTNVTGIMSSNTMWTTANSPYVINDTLVINEGVTLTIQAGVTVEFNDSAVILQRGNLTANGTAADSIIFTSSSATPYAGIYWGINISNGVGCIDSFNYCRFSFATAPVGEELGSNIANCVFTSDLTGIDQINGTISNCTFKYDSIAIAEPPTGLFHQPPVTSCVFINNGTAIQTSITAFYLNCTFIGNTVGIAGSAGGTIANCTFSYNKNYAIDADEDSIVNCTITNNGVGIEGGAAFVANIISNNTIGINGGGLGYCNSIYNNTQYNIIVAGSQNETWIDNYWGSTDSASIQATIYDEHQNLNLGLVNFMPFNTSACAGTGPQLHVWPGDANEDLVVNNYDLIPIGLYYGDTGTARSTITNTWAAQTATIWDSLQSNGYNRNFVDCNGDGTINSDDTMAISLNYGLTHILNKPRGSSERTTGTVPLSIATDSSSYHAGSTVHATVLLGSSANQASNIYGLAYDISLNTSFIQSGSIAFNYNNTSFMGAKNTNALVLTRINNDVETVVTGVDHTNKSGYGKIGDLYFTLTGSASSSQLGLSINSYQAVDAQGNQLALATGINQLSVNSNQLSIYPNPSNGEINIISAKNIGDLKVTNVLGQLIYQAQPNQTQLKFELRDAGLYFVAITSNNETVTSKILVSNK